MLREDLAARQVPWGKQSKALLGGSTSLALSDSVSVTLAFRPLALTVSAAGQPAIAFNAAQMFAMEHLREKKVGRDLRPACSAVNGSGISVSCVQLPQAPQKLHSCSLSCAEGRAAVSHLHDSCLLSMAGRCEHNLSQSSRSPTGTKSRASATPP